MSELIGTVLSELSDTDHQDAACSFHHVVGDRVQAVDPQDALDLDEQAVEQTANREALEYCRKRASKAHEAVRCTVNVEADKGTP